MRPTVIVGWMDPYCEHRRRRKIGAAAGSAIPAAKSLPNSQFHRRLHGMRTAKRGKGGFFMALRPLRNATITFGLVSIPVRFYTATKSEDIHFHLLHESCGTRVNRKWWCPYHEKIVSSDELIRGYEVSKGKYVTFTDEEMDALETDDNRALDIAEFVDLKEIDPVFFEKAYFLGPAPGGGKTYNLLSTAMKKQNKVGVARWVSSGKEHLVV